MLLLVGIRDRERPGRLKRFAGTHVTSSLCIVFPWLVLLLVGSCLPVGRPLFLAVWYIHVPTLGSWTHLVALRYSETLKTFLHLNELIMLQWKPENLAPRQSLQYWTRRSILSDQKMTTPTSYSNQATEYYSDMCMNHAISEIPWQNCESIVVA